MIKQGEAVECEKCDNTGSCRHCGGKGQFSSKEVCKHCKGSGLCHRCNGRGWILVPAVEQLS